MVQVSVNVYKIVATGSCCLSSIGLTPYHTGVQIGDKEFTFSEVGEVMHPARSVVDSCVFTENIDFGEIRIDYIRGARNKLRAQFRSGTYNTVHRNCNHYSEALIKELFGQDTYFPSYINRAARFGARVIKDVTDDDIKSTAIDTQNN